jgi:hypothetical protein
LVYGVAVATARFVEQAGNIIRWRQRTVPVPCPGQSGALYHHPPVTTGAQP